MFCQPSLVYAYVNYLGTDKKVNTLINKKTLNKLVSIVVSMRNYFEIPGDIETGLAKEGGGTISPWACLSFQWGDRVGEGKPHSVQMWNVRG